MQGESSFVFVIRDVTELTRVEDEALHLNAQLEAANQELETLAYSVSHDLRAPLRSIDGFSQILLEEYGDRLPARAGDYFQRMQAAAQRMAQLIDDLLQLSRVTRIELCRDDLDLALFARVVASDLQTAEASRDVAFVIHEPLKATGDANLVRLVLENLLGNAWKFTGNVQRATIEVGAKQDDGEVVYFVRDDGAGFDMAYAAKLFTPFQRLHAASEFPGTGIGLATVRRIVNRHGGRVWAEGVPERGATFYFTLSPGTAGRPPSSPRVE